MDEWGPSGRRQESGLGRAVAVVLSIITAAALAAILLPLAVPEQGARSSCSVEGTR